GPHVSRLLAGIRVRRDPDSGKCDHHRHDNRQLDECQAATPFLVALATGWDSAGKPMWSGRTRLHHT
ncbi:MAG: hypothetical protein ACREKF_03420, partial [Candidatus Methylomirabilales bacterium]